MCCILEEQACFEEQMDVLRQDMDTEQFERIWNRLWGLLSRKPPGKRGQARPIAADRAIDLSQRDTERAWLDNICVGV